MNYKLELGLINLNLKVFTGRITLNIETDSV